jgi:VanZ family protein
MKKKPPKLYYVKLFFGALEETFQIKKLIPYWLPVWAWMFFIFYLSSLSEFSIGFAGAFDVFLKKSWHIFAFFALAALIYRAFRSYGFSISDSYILGSLGSFVYAISDEIHQLFVPERHGCITDLLVDLVGIALFVILVKILTKEKKLKK